jgi:hypothetical protein
MQPELQSTGFQRLSPVAARRVLAVTIAATLLFIGIAISPFASGFADKPLKRPGDIALYHAIVDRIHAGENYYDAAAAELPERGFPTKSVFNWRTPLPLWLLGALPTPMVGRVLLALMALAMLLGSCHLLARDGQIGRGILCGLLMAGTVLPCMLDDLYVLHELWAGVLMALSVVAYGMRRIGWGVALGFAALVVRELAAPYCVVCCLMAVGERRWREVTAWCAAAVLYGLWYGAHVMQVLPHIGPNAIAHSDGWIRLGGAAFVVSIVQMNAYLLQLPQWITGIYLSLALLGFAGWTAPWGRRAGLTAAVYLGGFAIVGNPFNQYWGSLIAPLLCLGVAQAPAALADLWQRAADGQRARGASKGGSSLGPC